MKKMFLLGAMVLVLQGGGLLGQEGRNPYPYSYTLDKGVGEGIFTGVSLDQVWTATIKSLMLNNCRILFTEKQSGIMSAERRELRPYYYFLSLFFEQAGPDVRVRLSLDWLDKDTGVDRFDTKNAEKEEKNFYDGVAELLYGKVDK